MTPTISMQNEELNTAEYRKNALLSKNPIFEDEFEIVLPIVQLGEVNFCCIIQLFREVLQLLKNVKGQMIQKYLQLKKLDCIHLIMQRMLKGNLR